MSFEVTVTPTVYDVEVEVNPSVQPFDVEVTVGNVPDLDLTTNGDSGASTFDPLTGELNIPNYTLDGLGGVPESRTLTINGTTQDLSANRTFTIPAPDPVTIGSPANGLAIDGNQVLTIGLASGSQTGALSSTDWSTFNNKQNALGYTAEDVANKSTDTGLGTSNSLYPSQGAVKSYVDTGLSGKENALGFTPENVANKAINFTSPDDTKYPTTLAVSTALAGKQDLLTNPITGTGVAGQVSFWTGTGTQSGDSGLVWDNSTKNLRINQLTDAGFRLDVNGNLRVQGASRISNTNGRIDINPNSTGNFIYSFNSNATAWRDFTIHTNGVDTFNVLADGRVSLTSKSAQTGYQLTIPLVSGFSSAYLGGSVYIGGGLIVENANRLTFSSSGANNTILSSQVGGVNKANLIISTGFEVARFTTNENFIIGTTTDAGFRLDVNGTARVQGTITTGSPTGGTAKPFKIGAVATVIPTLPNRTIEIEIDGTTYYLTAKTTND